MNNVNVVKKNDNAELSYKINILVVAEAKISNSMIHAQMKESGHNVMMASRGEQMLAIAQGKINNIDVILIDCELDVDNILMNVRNIKSTSQNNIPIIMMIDEHDATAMQQGVEAGIFYYVTKPLQQNMLQSVLQAAITDLHQEKLLHNELAKHQTSFHLVDSCRFSFKTLAQAESLAAFMANCFPNPKRVLLGLGELLINAVEHGNLGIGYARKSELIASGLWRKEVELRLQLSKYSLKSATATIIRKTDGVYLTIEDMGEGFAWQEYMELNPTRASDNHGRGIALANATSFDRLTYNKIGNKVIGFMENERIFD